MIHYDDLFYANLSGGLFDGMMAVHLELGGDHDCRVSDLVKTLMTFQRCKVLKLMGKLKTTPDEDLSALLTVLRDNQWALLGELDPDDLHPWYSLLTYRIVSITENPWLFFAAQEIHFRPEIQVDIKPPLLQEIHKTSTLYIDALDSIPPREMLDFLKRLPIFRIYSPPRKVYRMALEVKDD